MKNRKGFTLIELLAVIVLLVAISAIAIPNITASIERSKNRQMQAKERVIIEAAKLYYEEHKNSLSSFIDGGCYIELDKLDLHGEELKDPDGNVLEGGVIFDPETEEYIYHSNIGGSLGNCR